MVLKLKQRSSLMWQCLDLVIGHSGLSTATTEKEICFLVPGSIGCFLKDLIKQQSNMVKMMTKRWGVSFNRTGHCTSSGVGNLTLFSLCPLSISKRRIFPGSYSLVKSWSVKISEFRSFHFPNIHWKVGDFGKISHFGEMHWSQNGLSLTFLFNFFCRKEKTQSLK